MLGFLDASVSLTFIINYYYLDNTGSSPFNHRAESSYVHTRARLQFLMVQRMYFI